MATAIIAVVTLVGLIFFWKLVLADTKHGKAVALFVVVGLVFYVMTFSNTSKPEPKPEVKPAIESDQKVKSEPTAAELEEKRRLKEETARRIAEEAAARERERAALRLPVEDFEARFLDNFNAIAAAFGVPPAAVMGEPYERRTSGNSDVIIYSLAEDERVLMSEIMTAGTSGVKAVNVIVRTVNRENTFVGAVAFGAAVKALSPEADLNAACDALSLNETVVENLDKSQSTTVPGFKLTKSFDGQTLRLGISE